MALSQQILLYEIIGSTFSMCQNTTMRVNGAWIKRCCVLCSKTYNTLHSCHNFSAGSRQAARGRPHLWNKSIKSHTKLCVMSIIICSVVHDPCNLFCCDGYVWPAQLDSLYLLLENTSLLCFIPRGFPVPPATVFIISKISFELQNQNLQNIHMGLKLVCTANVD